VRARADVIAVAHTADDVVEGVVLHLLRGCGIAGLRGVPPRRGNVIRPMLDVWRREVIGFLESRGVAALEDSSNRDETYARVRVRTRLLPALEQSSPGMSERLHRIASRANRWNELLQAGSPRSADDGLVERVAISTAPQPFAVEALRRLYVKAGGEEPALSRRQYKAMLALSRREAPGELSLPGGFVYRAGYEHIEIVRIHTPAQSSAARLRVRRCHDATHPVTATRAHLKSSGEIRVGRRTPGLRMRPIGGRGTRKLQDILVDAKVPRWERDRLPLVFVGDRLAWVPGIAVDRDVAAVPGQPCAEVRLEV
jgi:tRNA(Ile)-lysidine synthase